MHVCCVFQFIDYTTDTSRVEPSVTRETDYHSLQTATSAGQAKRPVLTLHISLKQ